MWMLKHFQQLTIFWCFYEDVILETLLSEYLMIQNKLLLKTNNICA